MKLKNYLNRTCKLQIYKEQKDTSKQYVANYSM